MISHQQPCSSPAQAASTTKTDDLCRAHHCPSHRLPSPVYAFNACACTLHIQHCYSNRLKNEFRRSQEAGTGGGKIVIVCPILLCSAGGCTGTGTGTSTSSVSNYSCSAKSPHGETKVHGETPVFTSRSWKHHRCIACTGVDARCIGSCSQDS